MQPFPSPEEDEPCLEASWPHLQVVYELLLRMLAFPDVNKSFAPHIDKRFVSRILTGFNSEDPRERDYLKTILHRVYGKFMTLRPAIRKGINTIFWSFMYQSHMHNGIAELLEILGSIINGYALPLKAEHHTFLQQVLLPLHRAPTLGLFHPQLSYCVSQFMEKDPSAGPTILLGLFKLWPRTSSKKEVMFLNELEEVLDRIQPAHLQKVEREVFTQIGRSMNSPHFQVAERAVYLINNELVLRYVVNNKQTTVPVLARALYGNLPTTEVCFFFLSLSCLTNPGHVALRPIYHVSVG